MRWSRESSKLALEPAERLMPLEATVNPSLKMRVAAVTTVAGKRGFPPSHVLHMEANIIPIVVLHQLKRLRALAVLRIR